MSKGCNQAVFGDVAGILACDASTVAFPKDNSRLQAPLLLLPLPLLRPLPCPRPPRSFLPALLPLRHLLLDCLAAFPRRRH